MDEQPQQDSSTASVPQGDTSTSPSQSIDPIEKNVSHRHGSFSQRPPLFSLAIAALIMIAGLGAGLMFMKQSQDVRSRATVTGTMLALSPGTATAAVGATIPIGVTINTDTDTVSAVVLSLSYDPTAIQIVSFTPGTVLPVPLVAETHDNGAISVTLAAQPTTPFTGAGILGTWQVKILAAKQSSISFTSATQVAAVDKTGNALIASTGSSITGSTAGTPTPTTILGATNTPTTTPTITPTPGPTGTPTPTPIPTLAPGSTIADNFSGTSLDTGKWISSGWLSETNDGGGSVTVSNGQATLYQPYAAGQQPQYRISLNRLLGGNVTVDATLAPNSGAHGQQDTHIMFTAQNEATGFSVGATGWVTGSQETVSMASWSPTKQWTQVNIVSLPVGTTSFRLRLVRSGSTATGYVDYGNGFISLGSISNIYSGDGYASLRTFNDGTWLSTNDVSTAFSNFVLTASALTLTPTPTATHAPTPTNTPTVTPTHIPGATNTPTPTITTFGSIVRPTVKPTPIKYTYVPPKTTQPVMQPPFIAPTYQATIQSTIPPTPPPLKIIQSAPPTNVFQQFFGGILEFFRGLFQK